MTDINGKIKIAVCDDCKEERKRILQLLSEYSDIKGYYTEADEFSSGEALLMSEKTYDLIFLDVIMNELNGIKTAEKLRETGKAAKIIFCSASREYAADSYDVSALYYLIKPVNEQKLFHALDMFFNSYETCKTISYKSNRMDETVLTSDVLYLESGKNHTTVIHTRFGDITTRTAMKELLAQLEKDSFVVPIRFAAVNLAAVVTVPTDVFTLIDGKTVPIARDKRGEMKNLFTKYRMKMILQKGGIK